MIGLRPAHKPWWYFLIVLELGMDGEVLGWLVAIRFAFFDRGFGFLGHDWCYVESWLTFDPPTCQGGLLAIFLLRTIARWLSVGVLFIRLPLVSG